MKKSREAEQSELPKPKSKISRKGKVIVIIMTVVIVLLAGGLVWLYLAKNNEVSDQKNRVNTAQKQLSDTQKQLTSAKNQLDTANKQIAGLQSQVSALQSAANSAPQYFVLADWGVKFLLPTGLVNSQIQYSINGDTVNFTTAEVAALGGYCKLNIAGSTPLGGITRSQSWNDTTGVQITYLNGYYYYYASPQSPCSQNNTALQTQDVAKIRNLLFGIAVN